MPASRTPTPLGSARGGLPSALRHVLAAYPAEVATRAEEAIHGLVPERLDAESGPAWSGSRLTGDGFPAEVAFSTTDDRLRLTIEPGPHDLHPAQRLALATERVAALGGGDVPGDLRERLAGAQSGGPLRFGAWVACRVSPASVAFKLYAEVTEPTVRWPGHAAPPIGDRDVALRMVAYTPATGDVETYLRIPSLLPEHMPAVLAPIGAAHRADAVLACVEALYGHRLRGRLPGPSVGVSYAPASGTGRVTVHFYARALWGDDRRIRDRFAEAASVLGWDAGPYLAVTEPLAHASGWRTHHGILGVTVEPGSVPWLTLGVRPVAP